MRRSNSTGLMALATLGGIVLWRNRVRMQKALESWRLRLPAGHSGMSKDSGALEHEKNAMISPTSQKVS